MERKKNKDIKYYVKKYINEFNKFSKSVTKTKSWEKSNIIIEDIIYIKDEKYNI